jgi:glycosyltransferase involved in cell wall biosynthesis
MRVGFLCNEYPPGPHGGIGTMTRLLGRALVQAGHEVRVAGAYPQEFGARAIDFDQGVHVRRIPLGSNRPSKMLARLRLWRIVSSWARAREIDVVEVPDWEGWAAGWPPLPVPVVVRLNGTTAFFAEETGERPLRLTSSLERMSLRRADAWCAASRYVAERTASVFGMDAGAAAILYNAVEIGPATPDSARIRGRVVFSGRLIGKKGVEPLVRAWSRVRQRVSDAELHLYGRDGPDGRKGSMRALLEALLADEPDPRVTFHGHVSREALIRALGTASVAVFPSFVEAFAFAPLEAMAAGCATISSERGSGPELMVDGRDGLLVDPGDSRQLADAIVCLLTDDELRRRLGAAGRRRVETAFSIAGLAAASEAFYRMSIDRFRASGKESRRSAGTARAGGRT